MVKWETFQKCEDPNIGCIVCGNKENIRYSKTNGYPVCQKDSIYSEEELFFFFRGKKIAIEDVEKTIEKYNCTEQQARIMLAKITMY